MDARNNRATTKIDPPCRTSSTAAIYQVRRYRMDSIITSSTADLVSLQCPMSIGSLLLILSGFRFWINSWNVPVAHKLIEFRDSFRLDVMQMIDFRL